MNDLDLRDLSAFAAVARHRSFRRAALELGVSVSSLSQRLRDLEERLGIRLLNRTTRSVAPTEAGEGLLLRLNPALREVADAVAQATNLQGEPSGRLRINGPAPAVHLVLAPMVAPFLKRHPRVELEVVVEPSLVDVVGAGFDAGIRYREDLAQDMVAVPLGPEERYVVAAAPEILADHGTPRVPDDLVGKPAIGIRFPSGATLPWEFEKDGRVVRVSPNFRMISLSAPLQVRAAVDGLGFYRTFEGYVRAEVAAGRLVTVLDDWSPPFTGPYLYYPSRRQPPPPLAAFVAFVAEWRRRALPTSVS